VGNRAGNLPLVLGLESSEPLGVRRLSTIQEEKNAFTGPYLTYFKGRVDRFAPRPPLQHVHLITFDPMHANYF
jgi:hypothetical protein